MHSQFPSLSEAKDYLLTAFLLIISAWLLISRNGGRMDHLRNASITIYSYLELPLSSFRAHSRTRQRNKELRKENIQLRNKLNRLRLTTSFSEAVPKFGGVQADSLSLYPVQFVGKELHQANNMLTINAGSKDGLKINMPVVTAKGLVGKIILVAPHFSEVMPYLNTLFKVSAQLQKSHAPGIVGWDGKNISELELNYVPKTIPVDSGEVVVTSGYSQQFPPNIPIGKVTSTELNEGRGTQLIYIQPVVNLYTATTGYVLTEPPDTAKKKLRKQYQKLFQ
jgi:rod shape-determining protein MreC